MGPLLLPSFPWQRALLIAFGALRITTIASQLPPISPTDEKSMFSRSCCFRFLRSSCLARSARVILGPAPGGRSCLGARIARIHPNAHPLAASLSPLPPPPPQFISRRPLCCLKVLLNSLNSIPSCSVFLRHSSCQLGHSCSILTLAFQQPFIQYA